MSVLEAMARENGCTVDDLVIGVKCDDCLAVVEQPCTDWQRNPVAPHEARVKAAERARSFGVLSPPDQRRELAADRVARAIKAYAPRSTARIALVSCSASKLDRAAPARELYTSPLFRKSVAYVEQLGLPWFVLSAKHGLVHPDQVLAPYDLKFTRLSIPDRRAWGLRLRDSVRSLECWSAPVVRSVVVLAGDEYTRCLRGMSGSQGGISHEITEPLRGKQVGERLAWLNMQLAEGSVTAALFYLGQLLACVTGARVATCPLGYFLDGIAADGRYQCLLVVGDNDDPPIDVLEGRAWCAPDEIAIWISPRRAECRRINTALARIL